MSAELRASLDEVPELIAGGNGIFDVRLDDELIFSKYAVGRFPEEGEITAILEQRQD